MRALTITAILAIAALLGLVPAYAVDAPQPTKRPLATTTTTTTTTLAPAPSWGNLERSEGKSCVGLAPVAYAAGWPPEEIPMLLAVAWHESRCLDVRGDKGISWTPYQIHTKSWCRPTKYYPDGYLQSLRIVRTCEDLADPLTAARAALAIWQYGGWKQWTTWKAASTTLGH